MFGFFKSQATSTEEEKVGNHLKSLNVDEIDWKAKTEEYWKENLTPFQYHVMRKAGTEKAFTGRYCKNCRNGKHTPLSPAEEEKVAKAASPPFQL